MFIETTSIINYVIYDRVFWIYFIVTLFFITIGVTLLASATDPYMLLVIVLWLLTNIILIIVTYNISLKFSPNQNSEICIIDKDVGCFSSDNRLWLLINVIFIILLVLSVLWAGELQNSDGEQIRNISGIFILLGGILLIVLTLINNKNIYLISFWLLIAYLLIWFGLILYFMIQS